MGTKVPPLLWAAWLLAVLSSAAGTRLLAQQEPDPFLNVVSPEPTTLYQRWQGADNDTLIVFTSDLVIRLTGSRFVPFTIEDQRVIIQALREITLQKNGPVELDSYKEFYPEPGAPEGLDSAPGVDLAWTAYIVLNQTLKEMFLANSSSWTSTWASTTAEGYATFLQLGSDFLARGKWSVPPPQMVVGHQNPGILQRGFILHPIIVMVAQLRLKLGGSTGASGRMSAQQASAVAQAVRQVLVSRQMGSLVEVANFTEAEPTDSVSLRGASSLAGPTQSQPMLRLEITLYVCKDNATVASPECEAQLLEAVFAKLAASEATKQELLAAGIQSFSVEGISQRQPPPPPNATAAPRPWVPWHLDRLDQRSLPLDGKFTATATGTGVNVYIISTGVLGTHEEFGYLDGRPGSRVKGMWSYPGLSSPVEDCRDARIYYGFGTMASSLCCGLKTGVAKNATIHSVRMRELCLSIYQPMALAAALDEVLANHTKPAIAVIDTWWSPDRLAGGDPNAIRRAYTERLDKLLAANVTVISSAGPGLGILEPCDLIFSSHPGVISVAASDTYDQATAYGPRNSSCIDMWGPSGGLGTGIIGAHPNGNNKYTKALSRGLGSAALVAGVAAQYLQYHPEASPGQVRRALLESATADALTDTGVAPNQLLYTDMVQPGVGSSAATAPGDGGGASSSGGGGLSTGAIVAIAVVSALVVAAVVMGGFLLVARRRRRLESFSSKSSGRLETRHSGWEIESGEIEILKHLDGSEVVLGEGRYGRVYKALKGGVQVVAVKMLAHVNDRFKEQFVKEIDMMKYVSRDANITQFYGACVRGEELMLVAEYMEGGDLRAALSGDRAEELQWYRRGKEVMLDVVRGVVFLHASNVIHRDIKSQNILLGRDGRAKLADVGLAQLLDWQQGEVQGQPQLLRSSSKSKSVGTLAWAAPEVLHGEATALATAADIYSLGVVLWEAVTREVPQRGRMRDPEVPRECPQGVADAIAACMQQDPALRPTAKELYALLLSCPPAASANPLALQQSSGSGLAGHSSGALAGPSSSGLAGLAAQQSSGETASKSATAAAGADGPLHSGSVGERGSEGPSGETSLAMESSGEKAARSVQSVQGSGSEKVRNGSNGWEWPALPPSGDLSMVAIEYEKLEFCKGPDGNRQKLGAGTFGTVYKALLDGVQPLAVKSVPLGQDAAVHSTFVKEAGMLWRLRHQNIVGLTGVSIAEGRGYLLMELMEGGPLYKQLNIKGKGSSQRLFAWSQRGKALALEIATGLHYLHSMRITHFDVKSGNILLTRHLAAKISDVGLARVMSCTHHSLTDEDSMGPPGTLAYMAPELMAGSKCNEKVDIFSFGILLHEICTGEHPVRGKMHSLRVPEDCPQAVADLFAECTHPDPAARPSARELVKRLTQARRARAHAAPAPAPSEPAAQEGRVSSGEQGAPSDGGNGVQVSAGPPAGLDQQPGGRQALPAQEQQQQLQAQPDRPAGEQRPGQVAQQQPLQGVYSVRRTATAAMHHAQAAEPLVSPFLAMRRPRSSS